MSEPKAPSGPVTALDHQLMCDDFVELLTLLSAAQRQPVSVRSTPEWQAAQQAMKTRAAHLLVQITMPF